MIRERAPAKVNLVLQVGDVRADGLHELCSLFASLDLADDVTVERRPDGADEVVCAGVDGPEPRHAARSTSCAPSSTATCRRCAVTIDKRIPVAAGLGGGSADAAAVLRAANAIAGAPLDDDALRAIGARIGADVPSQIEPRHALVTGAGEHVEPLDLPPMALVLVPQDEGLSTADVYREADRIGSTRARLDPDAVRALAGRAARRSWPPRSRTTWSPRRSTLRPDLAGELDALAGAARWPRASPARARPPSACSPTEPAAEQRRRRLYRRTLVVTALAPSHEPRGAPYPTRRTR